MIDDRDVCCRTSAEDRIPEFAFFVACGLAVVFCCLCFGLFGFASDKTNGTIELEHRINPNDASQASLARLPGIGLTRAQAIVTYREQFSQDGQGGLAFRDCNDLDKVKGIGPATARDMRKWLKFQ